MKSNPPFSQISLSILKYILAGAYIIALVLPWIFPSAPYGDGPFQTLNWISRIKEGQVPGRDFDVFHGIGLIWTHALVAFPFNSIRGVIWVHYSVSLVVQLLLWICVFRLAGCPWRSAFWSGISFLGALLLTTGLPKSGFLRFVNLGVFVEAGNSMTGARIALPLLVILSIYLCSHLADRPPWWKFAMAMGFGSGLGSWFATDQTLACLAMGFAASACFAWNVASVSWIRRSVRAAIASILAISTTVAVYLTLLYLSTGGSADRCLVYWWKLLPDIQFWYFGGAPQKYLPHYPHLFDSLFLIFMLATLGLLCLHILGIYFRKPDQWPLRLGLVTYGIVSMLPLLGMFALHYYSGLMCTGAIAILSAQWPERFGKRLLNVIPATFLWMTLSVICILLTCQMIHAQWSSRYRSIESLNCSLYGSDHLEEFAAVPDFVRMEQKNHPSSNLLRAFYRAVPEIALKQSGVGRYDYIIHALSEEQQKEYCREFEKSDPIFLRVPLQGSSGFSQWIWHHWPQLWEIILRRYHFEDIHDGSAYWRRAVADSSLRENTIAASVAKENDGISIRIKDKIDQGSLVLLTVAYKTIPIRGPLTKPVDKMTRITLHSFGVLDDQALSWPSGPNRHVKQVYLLPKPNSQIEIRLTPDGPFLVSGLEIESVTAEEVRGADFDGLEKTLCQP